MKIDVCGMEPSQWMYLSTKKEELVSEEDESSTLLGTIEHEIQKEGSDDTLILL